MILVGFDTHKWDHVLMTASVKREVCSRTTLFGTLITPNSRGRANNACGKLVKVTLNFFIV